ncbi:MAG: hypothetical protein COB24_12370 [Hyphomicrobiales bacterium]|nr:MAG: hypothetical protein COB24_12370 [Hyphomicrobiales bacterium]
MKQVAHKLNVFFKFLRNMTINGLFVVVFCGSTEVHAVETVYWVDNQSGTAMAGFDPISYFLRGQGDSGDYRYEYYWSGAVWRFQNEGNLVAFREYPLIYAPQFGGYDALKMTSSVSVTPDPRYGEVYGNRLYLFHNKKNLDIWSTNRKKYIRAAQASWQSMHHYGFFKNFDVIGIDPDAAMGANKPLTEKQKVLEKMDELDRQNVKSAPRSGLDHDDWESALDQNEQ